MTRRRSVREWLAVKAKSSPLVSIVAMTGLLIFQIGTASQTTTAAAKATDPGVRAGASGSGAPIAGLTAQQTEYFNAGQVDFNEAEEVGEGLGPRMNLDSCGGCHAQPAVGGSSPAVNPQVAFANVSGGTDKVPSFLTVNGPVREVRYIKNADGTADGGVHALFTINGRPGSGTACAMKQPDFATQVANRNVIFRIPTPVFGAGLMEQISDSSIVASRSSNAATKASLGIRGRPNYHVSGRTITGQTNNNGNDGTIARFGWKAQNKSLLVFSGEAYNVEMGITNELFMTERDENPTCQYASTPNSITATEATTPVEAMSSIEKFSHFMRFLAAPVPSATEPGGAASIAAGRALFASTGCALCHTPTLTTGPSKVTALSYQNVNLYSDLLLHDMGTGLSDGVSQGEAGPREFRTAPLWGLGQRLFFLHDGRASDLIATVRAHASSGSEANGVVARFLGLSETQKQNLLNFLRSL